jgi:valyl-tRNA synthetase
MQRNQQSVQQFNQMTNQRTQEFQQRQQQSRLGYAGRPLTRALDPAKQQQLEQEANEKLAQLAQQQQRQRQEHPAPDPQQAALQQKKDEQQLTLLAVKNYREVFLPGQVAGALQARKLTPKAQRELQNLNAHLMNNRWWKKQAEAQLPGSIKAYGDTLHAMTTGLLGFDLASPPLMPAPLSVSRLDEQLAADVFDQTAATQLVREAALSEKLQAGQQLIQTVAEFSRLSAAVTNPERPQDPKKLKAEVQASLRQVYRAMARYYGRINESSFVYEAEAALVKSTTAYEAKTAKGK